MTFVQAWDREQKLYVKIIVATGDVVATSPTPWPGIDEVEPIEPEPGPPPASNDPLEDFR